MNDPWLGKTFSIFSLGINHLQNTFLDYLCASINAMFKSWMFPNSLKLGDVLTLHKKGRKVLEEKKTIVQLVHL